MECVTLRDPDSGASARVLVGLGCNCFEFQVPRPDGPWDLLYAHPDFASGEQRPSGSGIPILFPFPGRLRGSHFHWQGTDYALTGLDALGNAIHGFVHKRPWQLVEQTGSQMTAEFWASRDGENILQSWPADFLVRVSYRVSGQTLLGSAEIQNLGSESLPFGLGWHPYFRLTTPGSRGPQVAHVRMPVKYHWPLQEMNPTGAREAADERLSSPSGLPLSAGSLDDVYSGCGERDAQGWAEGQVIFPATGRSIAIQFDRHHDTCVLYTPPQGEAVCIEPYSTLPNGPELSGRGIDTGWRELPPQGAFTAKFRILGRG